MIDVPISDLSRSHQMNPDETWPYAVKIQVRWRDGTGREVIRTEMISSDQFFGRGKYGAPIEGANLIAMIERMRRLGPPKVKRKIRGGK